MIVTLPPLDELAAKWHLVAPLLHKATSRTGCYEPIDLLALAMAGRVTIWLCESGAGIAAAVCAEVKQYPRKRILEMLFIGGSHMDLWLRPLVQAIDEYAKQTGCDIASVGRRGWARAWGGEVTGAVIVRGLSK